MLSTIGSGGTSEAAPEAVGWAVGGGCRSGWGQLEAHTPLVPGPHLQPTATPAVSWGWSRLPWAIAGLPPPEQRARGRGRCRMPLRPRCRAERRGLRSPAERWARGSGGKSGDRYCRLWGAFWRVQTGWGALGGADRSGLAGLTITRTMYWGGEGGGSETQKFVCQKRPPIRFAQR